MAGRDTVRAGIGSVLLGCLCLTTAMLAYCPGTVARERTDQSGRGVGRGEERAERPRR